MLIADILNAKYFSQICRDDADFKKLALLLHPDRCKDSRANEAFTHLNSLRDEFIKGRAYKDESGEFRSNGFTHTWSGDTALLYKSYTNYGKLMAAMKKVYNADDMKHWMQYFPDNYTYNNTVQFTTVERCYPLSYMLSGIENDPNKYKHINWVFSRMIEVCVMLEDIGWSLLNFSPESVFILPDRHGILIPSYYYLTEYGKKVEFISGRCKYWYPSFLLRDKICQPGIDITLAQKLTISNLGDKSGSGVILKLNKEINSSVLSYLMKPARTDLSNNSLESMKEWREILHNNFKSEFIKLEI